MERIACWILGFLALNLPILHGFEEKAHGHEATDLLTGGDAWSGAVMMLMRSSDGELFEVGEAFAYEWQTLKKMSEEAGADSPIPVAEVSSKILAKVIQYCNYHADAQKSGEDKATIDERVKAWDADFVKVDRATLFDLVLAANYLKIQSLLDLTCQTVADMIKGKTPQEIRILFDMANDLTPEEQESEEEEARTNQWTFE